VNELQERRGPQTKGVHKSHEGIQDEGIPALVRIVQERIDGVAKEEGERNPPEVTEGLFVVFLRLPLVSCLFLDVDEGKAPGSVKLGERFAIMFTVSCAKEVRGLPKRSWPC